MNTECQLETYLPIKEEDMEFKCEEMDDLIDIKEEPLILERQQDEECTTETSVEQFSSPIRDNEPARQDISKPHTCKICERKFKRLAYLKRHIKIHTGEKPFACDICDFRSIAVGDLRKHSRIHTGEKPFSCAICNFKTGKTGYLKEHFLRVHATSEITYPCKICDQKFKLHDGLRRHLKIHSDDKPFTCYICDHKCRTKSNLIQHLRIHSSETQFTCQICNCKYKFRSSLKVHLKHNTCDKELFACVICYKKFASKGTLTKHIKEHTDVKLLTCGLCDYKCLEKEALKVHSRIHF